MLRLGLSVASALAFALPALPAVVGTPPPVGVVALRNLTAIMADSWVGDQNPPYPGYFMGAYFAAHPEHPVRNFGKGGQGLDYWISQRENMAATLAYRVCVSLGRNDFMNGALTHYSGDNEAEFAAYCAKYRSCIDFTKSDLPGTAICCDTLTERHDGSLAAFLVIYNGYRKRFNAFLFQLKADGVIAEVNDIGGDAVLGADGGFQPDNGNPDAVTWDGLHLLDVSSTHLTGHGRALPMFTATMARMDAAYPPPAAIPRVVDPSLHAPVIAQTSAPSSTPFIWSSTVDGTAHPGMFWCAQQASDAAFTNILRELVAGVQPISPSDLADGADVTLAMGTTPVGTDLYTRECLARDDGQGGFIYSPWSNVLHDTIAVPFVLVRWADNATNSFQRQNDNRTGLGTGSNVFVRGLAGTGIAVGQHNVFEWTLAGSTDDGPFVCFAAAEDTLNAGNSFGFSNTSLNWGIAGLIYAHNANLGSFPAPKPGDVCFMDLDRTSQNAQLCKLFKILFTGAAITTTSGSNAITVTAAPTVGAMAIGQALVGPGIPSGTIISSGSGANWTLSANATASGTGSALSGGTLIAALDVSWLGQTTVFPAVQVKDTATATITNSTAVPDGASYLSA